ncbi:MAG: Rpn family recombination-promoting nuclease/putative transposase [Gammaproteobacteria bacterium]|nr:Rpn family recombination-promoting nuclease/putative transposase [Gammaproteobacteria bacterium]
MSKIYRTLKVAMADVRIARDFEHHLFKPMRALMNLRTLKFSPNTYVEEQLNAMSLDVLYQVNMHDGIGYL